jgi:hypothetical protein
MRCNLARDFYVIGAFEAPSLSYFPTHLQPIIAEKTGLGFRRWSYIIEKPYGLTPKAMVGSVRPIGDLFPIRSFLLLESPVRMHRRTQVIALSERNFIISKSKVMIVLRLVMAVLARFWDISFAHRTWKTIWNSIF